MTLSRVAYQEIAYSGTTDTRTFASISWNAGDLIIVLGVGEDTTDRPLGAPTLSGLTFTAITGTPLTSFGNCWVGGWQATATAAGSGTVSITAAGTAGKMWGGGLWQYRGHRDVGVSAVSQTGGAVATVSLAVSAGSAVVGVWADWNAGAMGKTGTPTVTNEVEDAAQTGYSIWSGDWLNEAAGTRNYGITSATSSKSTLLFIEIRERLSVPQYVKEVGFVTNTTGATTSAISTVPASGVPAGDVLVIYGACDNTGTNGVATTIAVADDSGETGTANVYTLLTPQAIADPGAASAGQQGFFVVCPVTRPLLVGDIITVTFGNSTAAKAINCQQFANVDTTTPVLAGSYAVTDNQTGTASTVTTVPDTTGQIVCALVAVEGGTADGYTQDADTTNGVWVALTRRGSGTTAAGSTLNSVYKVVTAAGSQTYNPTLGTARDSCTAALVLDLISAGGTTFEEDYAGSITASGATAKADAKAAAGSTGPTGAATKRPGKGLAGSSTGSGALTRFRTIGKSVSGSITGTGALAKLIAKAFAGSSTLSGATAKADAKAAAGSVGATGAASKSIGKGLAGSTTPTGALANLRTIAKAVAGSITPSGLLAKLVGKALAGSSTGTGAITRTAGKGLAGSSTLSGSTAKAGATTAAGSIGPTGAASKMTGKALSGSSTGSGLLSLTRVALRAFGGSVTGSGLLAKLAGKVAGGSTSPSGATAGAAAKATAGSLGPSGAAAKAVSKGLAGSTSGSGMLTFLRVAARAFDGSITAAGSLVRAAFKAAGGSTAPAGGISKSIDAGFSGDIGGSGSAGRGVAKAVGGTVTASGAVSTVRATFIALSGAITAAGGFVKSIGKALGGSITGSGSETGSGAVGVGGSITLSGALSKLVGKLVAGVLTFAGNVATGAATDPVLVYPVCVILDGHRTDVVLDRHSTGVVLDESGNGVVLP